MLFNFSFKISRLWHSPRYQWWYFTPAPLAQSKAGWQKSYPKASFCVVNFKNGTNLCVKRFQNSFQRNGNQRFQILNQIRVNIFHLFSLFIVFSASTLQSLRSMLNSWKWDAQICTQIWLNTSRQFTWKI